MGCQTICVLGENLTFTVQAKISGSPADATGNVSYKVYEDETDAEILSGTMTKLDDAGSAGFYSEQIACTAANGFERFKSYSIRITGTVSGGSYAKTYNTLCIGGEDSVTGTTGALTTTANFKTYAGITHSDDDALIAALIARATSALEAYCDRILREDAYREILDGNGGTMIFLRQYPVTAITLLATSVQNALQISNSSADAYNAYVTVTAKEADPSISETMIVAVNGGANDGTDSLTLADYTVTELAAAIVALGKGWAATVENSAGAWESIELLPAFGLGCFGGNYAYPQTPSAIGTNYVIKGMTQSPFSGNNGELHLSSGFIGGNQNVIVKYTAGYSTTPADLEQITIELVMTYYQNREATAGIKAERLGDHSITYDTGSGGLSRDIPESLANRLASYKRWAL